MNFPTDLSFWISTQSSTLAFLYYLISSFICFTLYARDKWIAVRSRAQKSNAKTHPSFQLSRISENKLLVWTLISGGLVALLAQQLFRHKTQKPTFAFAAMLAFVAHTGAWYYVKIAS